MAASNQENGNDYKLQLEKTKTFISSVFSGSNEEHKKNLANYLKETINNIEKIRPKKRKFLEIISELQKSEEIRLELNGDSYVIVPKKQKILAHNIDLPDEIWRKIFSYLSTNTILRNVTRVCKRFNDIAKDPTMLKAVNLHGLIEYDMEYVVKVLERCKSLSELSILNCKQYPKMLSVALKSNINLKTLKVGFYDRNSETGASEIEMTEETAKIILDLGKRLEHLHIRQSLTKEAVSVIVKMVNLKTLYIDGDETTICAKDFKVLARECTKLENLNLNILGTFDIRDVMGNVNYDEKEAELKDCMKIFLRERSTSLKQFIFNAHLLRTSRGSNGFFETIHQCQNLETLKVGIFGNYQMNKKEVEAIARLPKLKKIELSHSIEDDILREDVNPEENSVLNSFVTNVNLDEMKHLSLMGNSGFNIETMNCLANRSCPNLAILDLEHCDNLKLNTEVLKKLVKNCPKLEILNISGVEDVDNVSDEFMYHVWSKNGLIIKADHEKLYSLHKYIKYNFPLSEDSKALYKKNELLQEAVSMAEMDNINYESDENLPFQI